MKEVTYKPRTQNQNSALWLYFTHLAKALNDAGLDMKKVLKPSVQITWNKDLVHDHLWVPIQKSVLGTESTKDLKKIGEIDQVYDIINRHISEQFGIHIPFPDDPDVAPLK
jgi:hypothetical protein